VTLRDRSAARRRMGVDRRLLLRHDRSLTQSDGELGASPLTGSRAFLGIRWEGQAPELG